MMRILYEFGLYIPYIRDILVKYSYQILMMRVIDSAALDEQYVSVFVLPQHLDGRHSHFAKRWLVSFHFLSARVRHMAHGEQTCNYYY